MSETIVVFSALGAIILFFIVGTLALFGYNKQLSDEYGAANVKNIRYNEKKHVLFFNGGKSGHEYVFRGNCTVWYHLDGTRCGVTLETYLSEIWHKWKYDGEL